MASAPAHLPKGKNYRNSTAPPPTSAPAHILHDQRDMPTRRLACLALYSEARLEQRIIGRRQRLGAFPRHGAVAVGLARRRGHDESGVSELRSVQGQHILNDELRRVAVIAVLMPLDVEADYIVTLREQPPQSSRPSRKKDQSPTALCADVPQ